MDITWILWNWNQHFEVLRSKLSKWRSTECILPGRMGRKGGGKTGNLSNQGYSNKVDFRGIPTKMVINDNSFEGQLFWSYFFWVWKKPQFFKYSSSRWLYLAFFWVNWTWFRWRNRLIPGVIFFSSEMLRTLPILQSGIWEYIAREC